MRRRAAGVIGAGFWQRLVGRHRRRTALCRPRAALALRRNGAAPPAERVARRRDRWDGGAVLHVHLAWPAWLRPAGAPAVGRTTPATSRTKAHGRGAMGAASRHPEGARFSPNPAEFIRPVTQVWGAAARVASPVSLPSALTWAPRVHSASRLPIDDRSAGQRPRATSGPDTTRVGARPLVPAMAVRPARVTAARRPLTLTWNAAHPARATARGFGAPELIRRMGWGPDPAVTRGPGLPPVRRVLRGPDDAGRPIREVLHRWVTPPAPSGGSSASSSGGRFFQPVSRTLAQPAPAHAPSSTAPAGVEASPLAPASAIATRPTPPQIDIARLSDEVYRQIERRARIERERRGM